MPVDVPCFLTVAAVASALGIRRGKVLAWISRGELTAVNIAERATGRPRWRISRESLDAFLLVRSCRPPVAARRVGRRKSQPAGYVEYF